MSSSRPDCRRIPGIALSQRCDAHHRPARSSNHEELPCVGLLHQAREVEQASCMFTWRMQPALFPGWFSLVG